MKLKSISIQNLRSLVDIPNFDLSPLTLVVGANSSGKSTFVRSFPLLRQSVETVTKGPILWFGRFVDFGVFKDAVSRDIADEQIEFGFEVTLPPTLDKPSFAYYYPYLPILEELKVEVRLVVAAVPQSSNTYTKRIRVLLCGRVVEIDASPSGAVESFKLDGHPIKSSLVDLAITAGSSLFSVAVSRRSGQSNAKAFQSEWAGGRQLGAFPDKLHEKAGDLFHGSTRRAKKEQFCKWLGIGSRAKLLEQVRELSNITPTSKGRARVQTAESSWMKNFQGLVIADRIPQLLNEVDSFLSSTFAGVSYIGPLRATAERFYRQQDLAVDEVDPQGANLAMFLMGLRPADQAAFSKWCEQTIGFSVEAKPIGAHVSINLSDSSNGEVFNIADMGFGYSQLLPVLATIWRALNSGPVKHIEQHRGRRIIRPDSDRQALPKIIAIEQPELHLHPRLQGRLADLLCVIVSEASKSSNVAVNLVCETHSETIINRIGKLISERKIDASGVRVLVFEKTGKNRTHVRTATYDQNGVLKNWPFGFFLPDDD